MTDIQDEGGDPSRLRDPGIAEALLRLGPEAAAAHPGVLTQCGGTWVHHVCDGRTVEAREVSGAELEVLQARIRDFRDRMESLLALARDSGDAGSGDALKDAALDDAARAFGQGFDRVLGELDGARPDLDAMELQLRDNALSGSAAAYRAVLEARDAALPAPECPNCGRAMKRRRRKVPKTFLTRVGEVTVRRSHYHCRRCGEGKVPLDDFLGLEGTSMSPGAERMIAELAVEVPVRKAQSLLKELSGLSAGRSRLWEKAVELGGEAVRFEREAVAPTGGERPERIYASFDGTGVPMRSDALEGRAGKGDDGRASTREAKLLRLYEMASDPGTGKATTVQGSVTQSAAIDSAAAPEHGTSAFEARLRREAQRRGAHDAREVVIVSDGAPWIENTADRVFGTGNVTYILDQFHVLETLRAAVRAMEPDPAEEERRYERLKQLVKAGEVEPVVRELSRHAKRHEEVAKCVGYFRKNLHRMRYGDCRAKGMPVGSGVIEGGCKSVICGRMKKGGARWSMTGANNIMALRCCSLKNQMTDLFDWRRAA